MKEETLKKVSNFNVLKPEKKTDEYRKD